MTIESRVLANVEPHASRTWWLSAAICAFLASGMEILTFALSRLQRSGAVESAGSTPSLGLAALAITELMLVLVVWMFLFSVAVEATALWGVRRRQRAVAPVIARLGQWAVAAYVVLSAPLFVLIVLMNVGGFGVWPTVSASAAQFLALAKDSWVFTAALISLTLVLVCLRWASRGGTSPWHRFLSGGMLDEAISGFWIVNMTLFFLPVRIDGLWLWLDVMQVAWPQYGPWRARR